METLRQKKVHLPYIEEDTGKELDKRLSHDDVEIIFVYIQPDLNADFIGQVLNPSRVERDNRKPKDLGDKVVTMYGHKQ